MKIIFLDIDGVLNSASSCLALGGYPQARSYPGGGHWELFDPIACAVLRKIVGTTGANCVLSSTWRSMGAVYVAQLAQHLRVPIVGVTRCDKGDEPRGEQIDDWLVEHPEVSRYIIIDDNSDMLPHQEEFFVHVNGAYGLGYDHFIKSVRLLGENNEVNC